MDGELDVTEAEALEDLRDALGIPDVWEHDERTWTVNELADKFGLGRTATNGHLKRALEEGTMVEGQIRNERGHYVRAFRLAG